MKLSEIPGQAIGDNDALVGVRTGPLDCLFPVSSLVNYLKSKFPFRTTSTPTITAGAGLGTGGSVSILVGNDNNMTVSVTIGTTPASAATVAEITYGTPKTAAPSVVWSPANSNASLLSGPNQVIIFSLSAAVIRITAGGNALIPGANYQWSLISTQL